LKDFSYDIKSLSSTNNRNEIGNFRFLTCFSKMWKIEDKQRAEKIGNKTEPCPTPTLILKKEEEKFFYKYWVLLPTK